MTSRTAFAAGLDVLLVLVFAAIGRMNHGESVLGAPLTALPFWIGLALGWWLVRQRSGRAAVTVGTGITVWLCTLVVGVVLRLVLGIGAALSFVIVAALVLAILLIGWRLIAERVAADRAEAQVGEEQHDDIDA